MARGYSAVVSSDRRPDSQIRFSPEIPEKWLQFAVPREDLLIDYGYNKAGAYWADFQDFFEWAVAGDKDVLQLTERGLRQHVALLRRRKHSESSNRRRITVMRPRDGLAVQGNTRFGNASADSVPRPP